MISDAYVRNIIQGVSEHCLIAKMEKALASLDSATVDILAT